MLKGLSIVNKTIAVTALSLVLAACGQESPVTESDEKTAASAQKYSGIFAENMNLEVRPGDDFNAYVNGAWMDSAEIPADRHHQHRARTGEIRGGDRIPAQMAAR